MDLCKNYIILKSIALHPFNTKDPRVNNTNQEI